VIILTIHENEPFPSRALEAGAMGYITKHCDPEELIAAIRAVARGEKYVDNETEKKISSSEHIEEKKLLSKLTSREFQIFTMLANGKSYLEIAKDIDLSPKTVQVHRANLLKKLNISSTSDIIHMAIRHNLSETANILNH
jgi:two-component system invasion response regulator UvrY